MAKNSPRKKGDKKHRSKSPGKRKSKESKATDTGEEDTTVTPLNTTDNNNDNNNNKNVHTSKETKKDSKEHGQTQDTVGALPEIPRSFLVTHKSDNWKLRKASLQKQGEEHDGTSISTRENTPDRPQSKNQENYAQDASTSPQEFNQSSEKFGEQPSGGVSGNTRWFDRRRYSADAAILTRQRQSVVGMLNKLAEKNQSGVPGLSESRKSIVAALISPRDAPKIVSRKPRASLGTLPMLDGNWTQNQSGSQAHGLDAISEGNSSLFDELDEGFDEDVEIRDRVVLSPIINKDDEDADEESSGFDDSSVEREKRMRLMSDDYDTDLSEVESDGEHGKPRSPIKNKTLHTYMIACSKCHLRPNPTFVRQCGFSLIDIRNRMLTAKDAKPISIALVEDKRAFSVDISDNPLGPLGISFIAEMLYANNNIIELNLSKTYPGREGLLSLAQTLPRNNTLRRLQLDSNNLQQRDGEVIATIINTVPELRELHLEHNALGFLGMKHIALALAANKGRLSVLNLKYNNIRTNSAVVIALALGKNTTLRTLNLSWNGIGFDGCRALSVSLPVNKTLRELDLTCNRLGLNALGYLIKGLNKNTTLSCIKVARNPLTTEGAKALVSAISAHEQSGLTDVDLRDVPVDAEFIKLSDDLQESRIIRVHHDNTIHIATTNQTKTHDGNELDRFDPVMVLFEYMKKDNLRVIDLFQFFDQRKRDKLSKSDLRDGINTLMIPFTEDAIDRIMKTLDVNRDGFISLEEMNKGYKESDRIVKLRRIKANQKRKPDKGLEDLWRVLAETIEKRKAENERRSVASNEGGGYLNDVGGANAGGGAGQRRMSRAQAVKQKNGKKR